MDFKIGKNRYKSIVDGDEQEYYVHVPADYDPDKATPLVFMLRAASSRGETAYKISGWTKLGDDENILTVFPSSWSYCLIKKNGVVMTNTKWNGFTKVDTEYCQDETPRDDVKFLRQVFEELMQRFNVDARRVYLVGFSNGGHMAFRCAVEMSDVLAAIVQSAGSYYRDTVFTSQRNLPITFQIGNRDNNWLDGKLPFIPMSEFDSLLNYYPVFRKMIKTHSATFDFEPDYTMTGDTKSVLMATFKGIPDVGNRDFRFILIKGLEHKYPNGSNHPINGARQNWEWMKQFTVP